jgi:hypothetical protein
MMHKTATPKTGLDIVTDNQTTDIRNVLGNTVRGGSGGQLSLSLDSLRNADWDAMNPWSKSLASGVLGGGLGGLVGGGAAYLSPKKRGESKSQRRSRIMRQAMLGTGLGAVGGAAIPQISTLYDGPNAHVGSGKTDPKLVAKVQNLDEQHENTLLPGAGWIAKAKNFLGLKSDPTPSYINQDNINLMSGVGGVTGYGASTKLLPKGSNPAKVQNLQDLLAAVRGTPLNRPALNTNDLGGLDDIGKLQKQLRDLINPNKLNSTGGVDKDSKAVFDALSSTNNPGKSLSTAQVSKQLRSAGLSRSEVNQFLNNSFGVDTNGVRNPQNLSPSRTLPGKGSRIGGKLTPHQRNQRTKHRTKGLVRGGVTVAGAALPQVIGNVLMGDSQANQTTLKSQLSELKEQLIGLKGTATEYPTSAEYQQILDNMQKKYPKGYGGTDRHTLKEMLIMINMMAGKK